MGKKKAGKLKQENFFSEGLIVASALLILVIALIGMYAHLNDDVTTNDNLKNFDMAGTYTTDGSTWYAFESFRDLYELRTEELTVKGHPTKFLSKSQSLIVLPANLEMTVRVNEVPVSYIHQKSNILVGTGKRVVIIGTGGLNAEDELTFELRNPYYENRGFRHLCGMFFEQIYYGEGNSVYITVFENSIPGIVMAMLVAMMGILALVFYLLIYRENHKFLMRYIMFAIFDLIAAAAILTDSLGSFLPLFLRSPAWCNVAEIMPVYLLAICTQLYYCSMADTKYRRIFQNVCIAGTYAALILVIVLQFTGVMDFYPSQEIGIPIMGVCYFASAIGTFVDGINRKDRDVLAILLAMAPTAVAGLLQCTMFMSDYSRSHFFVSLSLICTAIALMATNVIKHRREQEQSRKSKDASLLSKEVIRSLSHEYVAIYQVFPEEDRFKILYVREDIGEELDKHFTEENPYSEAIEIYAGTFVPEGEKEKFLREVGVEGMREHLKEWNDYEVPYRGCHALTLDEHFFKANLSRLEIGEQSSVLLGIRDITRDVLNLHQQKEEIERALEQAREANEIKNTFLSGMSHEVRTPLNAIIGFATIAQSHPEDTERVADCMEKIVASGNHMMSLVSEMLDVNHLESDELKLDEKPAGLAEIMHDIRNLYQEVAGAKQITFLVDTVDVVDEEIYCDKNQLKQMLMNFVANAIQYTYAGGHVNFYVAERSGAPVGYGTYEFHIKDDGRGMSREFIGHAFEPFAREQDTTASGIFGVGLGLTISKKIIDAMGGKVEIKSELGKGSEFVVTLDMRLQTNPSNAKPIHELEGKLAIVTDRDLLTGQNICRILEKMGMKTLHAADGEETLRLAKEICERGELIGACIIDSTIQDKRYLDVVNNIRDMFAEKEPLFLLSMYNAEDIGNDAARIGVSDFLCKPIFYSNLKYSLMKALGMLHSEKGQTAVQTVKKQRTGRLLLVEDNELNREMAQELLADSGYEVITAEDGVEAVKTVLKYPADYFNLILMDIQMPRMDGYDATAAIRRMADEKRAALPIVAMTANTTEDDKQRAMDSGMNGFVGKPIVVGEMIETIENILEQRSK